ncbi:MAG TPA: DUF4157 domain-containing protein [Ilumatobacteraceae bacterium]|nr:DUF4157 domain-containing protein [Ilumatobacteraceae bacterium]
MVPSAEPPASTRSLLQRESDGGVAALPLAAAVASRPSLPEPGAVPDRAARPVAAIDVPAGTRSSTEGVDTGGAGRHRTRADQPLVGSRPTIQRIADAPAGAGGFAGKPSGRPVAAGTEHDHEPVPVRWGPIAQPGVQRAPEGVPADLRTELEPVLGTALDDVRVHRDADTGEAARQLSAKAFTAGGEVFLPDWHGSTTGGEARTILTHELTHVAQQRRLGSALPDEASAAGTELESEARAVAHQGPAVPTRPVAPNRSPNAPQRLEGVAPSPPARVLAPRPAGGMSPSDVAAQVQAAASAAGIAPAPPDADDHHSKLHRRADGHGPSPTTTVAATAPSGGGGSSVVQRLPDQGSSTSNAATPEKPSDDPAQLDELARRLYPRFRTRLRQDLLADRERSGRLFDVR